MRNRNLWARLQFDPADRRWTITYYDLIPKSWGLNPTMHVSSDPIRFIRLDTAATYAACKVSTARIKRGDLRQAERSLAWARGRHG